LQAVSPPPQVAAQTPTLHTWPIAQALPQAPQLAASMRVSAQPRVMPSPQSCNGDAHDTEQAPLEHTLPAGQRLPQAPQLSRSVCVDTQRPAQATCPIGHVT